jgi:hypothetical protein
MSDDQIPAPTPPAADPMAAILNRLADSLDSLGNAQKAMTQRIEGFLSGETATPPAAATAAVVQPVVQLQSPPPAVVQPAAAATVAATTPATPPATTTLSTSPDTNTLEERVAEIEAFVNKWGPTVEGLVATGAQLADHGTSAGAIVLQLAKGLIPELI